MRKGGLAHLLATLNDCATQNPDTGFGCEGNEIKISPDGFSSAMRCTKQDCEPTNKASR